MKKLHNFVKMQTGSVSMENFNDDIEKETIEAPIGEIFSLFVGFILVLASNFFASDSHEGIFKWLNGPEARKDYIDGLAIGLFVALMISNLRTQKLVRKFGIENHKLLRKSILDIRKLVDKVDFNYSDFVRDFSNRGGTVSNVTRQLVEASYHKNRFIAYPALHALTSFFREITVSDERIDLKSYYMARQVYINFWKEIINLNLSQLPGEKIEIFACHAANLKIWLDALETLEERDKIVDLQEEFFKGGGVTNRIFIRGKDSEPIDKYDKVIEAMTQWGVNAYLCNVNNINWQNNDFMLCKIENVYYVLAWEGKNIDGGVEGCSIFYGTDACRKYIDRWNTLVRMLHRNIQSVNLKKIDLRE